jgi:hypothetical protein
LVSFLYKRFVMKQKIENWVNQTLSSLYIALAWLLVMAISIWTAGSVNIWVFGVVASGLIFALLYSTAGLFYGINGRHKIFYSVILTILLNPLWFIIFGTLR